MKLEYVPTICPYCGCGCGIYLVIKDGEIVGIEPWKEHPVSEGTNCIKGKSAYKFLYSQERLKTPLIKENGTFKETSWDEALALIAEKLGKAYPESVGILGSGKTTNEEGYLLQKFARIVIGTNNIEYCARLCHSATVAGLLPTVGSGVMQTSQLDIEHAECIFIAGANIKETFPMVTKRVLRAKQKGAKVIVIDPRKTATARYLADVFLQLKPGTDVMLLNAIMKIILNEELEDKNFIKLRSAGIDELKDFLSAMDLEKAIEITGVPLTMIREAALTYAKAGRSCILYDEGITQHTTGGDNVKSLANLALLTGNIGKPGAGVNSMRGQINGEGTGDMGCLNVFYPGFKRVGEESVKFFKEAWEVDNLPAKPGLPYTELLNRCKFLYIVGTNPLMAAPDTTNVKRNLEKADFIVVQDIFMTETAKRAHVVLPAATWVEREGTHTWMDRRIQKIDKVVDPPGQAKPDWWIICKLAEKMGRKDKFNFSSAGEIFKEIRSCVPQYRGITYERLKKAGGIHWPCPSEDQPGTPTMFMESFATPDAMGHFQVVDYNHPAELPDDEYPFILTTGRSIFHYHGGTMTRKTDILNNEMPQGFVQVNAKDAMKLGIRNNEMVTLKTRRGSIQAKASISEEVQTGLLFVPIHFAESCANVLTNPALDPSCKMPEFKVCAVRMEVRR